MSDLPLSDEKEIDEFYVQALLLAEVVKRILKKKADIKLSRRPIFQLKPVVEFMKRMRVVALEKFGKKTYISTINFYRDEEDLEQDKVLGAIILYVEGESIVKLLEDLQYPLIDEDDEDGLEDGCGTFCNLIAGNFKSGITQLGYKEIVMSHFTTYQNDIVNGVPYCAENDEIYEISFYIKKEKKIVIDLNMGPVPKVEPEPLF